MEKGSNSVEPKRRLHTRMAEPSCTKAEEMRADLHRNKLNMSQQHYAVVGKADTLVGCVMKRMPCEM